MSFDILNTIVDTEMDEFLSESASLDREIKNYRFEFGARLYSIQESFVDSYDIDNYNDRIAIMEYQLLEASEGVISKLISWIEKGFNILFKRNRKPTIEEFYAMKDQMVELEYNPKEEISKLRKFKDWISKWTNPANLKKVIPPIKDVIAITGVAVVGGSIIYSAGRKKVENAPGGKYICKAADAARDLDIYNREMDDISKTMNKHLRQLEEAHKKDIDKRLKDFEKQEKKEARKQRREENLVDFNTKIEGVKQSFSGFFSHAGKVCGNLRGAVSSVVRRKNTSKSTPTGVV